MAVINLNIILPDDKTTQVGIEDISSVEQLISNLVSNELLKNNGDYEIVDKKGNVIDHQSMIQTIKGGEITISDNFSMPGGTPKLPRYFHQLGILLLDGSGSMTDKAAMNSSKAKEVDAGVRELFNRLNASRVKQNFSFSVLSFDKTVETVMPVEEFDYSKYTSYDFDPLIGNGGGTHIFEALAHAKTIAEQFVSNGISDDIPYKVLIMLMSDGICFEPEQTKQIATDIKANPSIQIASCYFATVGSSDGEAIQLLKDVSSDPVAYYSTVYDGEALRAFFERSISNSSGTKIG